MQVKYLSAKITKVYLSEIFVIYEGICECKIGRKKYEFEFQSSLENFLMYKYEFISPIFKDRDTFLSQFPEENHEDIEYELLSGEFEFYEELNDRNCLRKMLKGAQYFVGQPSEVANTLDNFRG